MSERSHRAAWIFPLLGIALAGAGSAAAATCQSITANAATFTFDRAYTCGQFASGDWWVVPDAPTGRVTLTALAPSPYSSACTSTGRDGWEVNPAVGESQALDARLRGTTYSPARMPCLPYAAAPGQSIVKVKSWNPTKADCWWTSNSTTETCLSDAAVLTVLAQAPPADTFRPPYVGTSKPLYSATALDLSRLPRLAAVSGMPTLAQARAMFGGPWLDHFRGWPNRSIHPANNMRGREDPNDPADYGAEVARTTAEGTLRLLHNESDAQKRPLAIALTQVGIDLYHQLLLGQTWSAHGGHGNGRKLPILVAGLLLGDAGMLGIGRTHYTSGTCGRRFSEDEQTYLGEGGIALFGQAGPVCGCGGTYGGDPDYTSFLSGGCTSGRDYCRDPRGRVDGASVEYTSDGYGPVCRALVSPATMVSRGEFEAGAYQYCCTSAPFIGTQIAALLLGLKDEWGHDAFFAYVDRWMSPPWNGEGWYGEAYFNAMHRTYRTCAPNCGAPPDTTPPSPPVLLE